MKIMGQIGIVFGICLIGELVASILPIPFPSSVISMALVFILLLTGLLKPKHIQEKSDFLLRNMAFFFIPAGVGIMEQYEVIKSCAVQLLIICIITTIITFAVTAYTVKIVIAIQDKVRRAHYE